MRFVWFWFKVCFLGLLVCGLGWFKVCVLVLGCVVSGDYACLFCVGVLLGQFELCVWVLYLDLGLGFGCCA